MDSGFDFEYLKYTSEHTDTKRAISDLMTAYGNDVWNYAFSIVRSSDLADDIAQDAFLKAYRNLSSFRGQSSVKTWLLAITRNTAYDYKRSAFLRMMKLDNLIPFQGIYPSAESEAIEKFAVSDIWRKVLNLPAKYREVLILYAHHQLSMKEMADLLGISEGAVKSRLHQARQKIAKLKERESNEPK